MADSTVIDYSKMKVAELRKELKSRGLTSGGDKSELVARLQAAVAAVASHDEFTLDSDEIDSDGVLEDEDDDKTDTDITLDISQTHASLHEELADLSDKPKEPERKPKTLKRKLIVAPEADKKEKSENGDGKESGAKKIVLHRPASIPASEAKVDKPAEIVAIKTAVVSKVIPEPEDVKSKLELRAKRFGLPLSETDRKEARKIRFGQTGGGAAKVAASDSNLEKLRKRAERFGQSVSKAVTDVESQERLAKRRAKFGSVK